MVYGDKGKQTGKQEHTHIILATLIAKIVLPLRCLRDHFEYALRVCVSVCFNTTYSNAGAPVQQLGA